MSDQAKYESLFKEAGTLIEGRVNLDGRPLGRPGFFEKRRLLKALRLLEQAAEVEPPYGAASLFAAKVHERLGNSEERVRWLRRAQSVAPRNLIVGLELGGALSSQGLHTEAIIVLKAALELDPNDPRVLTNLGLSLLMAGEAKASVAAFERLCALEPGQNTNQRLLNLAVEVQGGRKTKPTNEAEIIRSL